MANYKINTTNSTGGYQQPINPNADGALAYGFYPQNSTSNDAAVGFTRDETGGLVLSANSNPALTVLSLIHI